MQFGIDQWIAFGIAVEVGTGIESLHVSVAFHSPTEAKGPGDMFDNRGINTKFLMSETHPIPFLSIPIPIPKAIPTTMRRLFANRFLLYTLKLQFAESTFPSKWQDATLTGSQG